MMDTASIDRMTVDISPFQPYERNDYEQDLARHQVFVTIRTREERSAVQSRLRYAKKYYGRGSSSDFFFNSAFIV